MFYKKFGAILTSGFLLLSMFLNVPLSFAAPGDLNEPFRLEDINLNTESFYPRDFVEFQGRVYFVSGGEGEEGGLIDMIYYVDIDNFAADATVNILGYPEGDLEDTDLDELYYNPASLTVFDNKLYFVADSNGNGRELWVYDGQSVSMLKDIAEGEDSAFNSFLEFYVFGDWMYFVVEGNVPQLWVSDGTSDGTFVISQFNQQFAPDISNLTSNNGEVYFSGPVSQWNAALFEVVFEGNSPVGVEEVFYEDNLSEFDNFVIYAANLYFTAQGEDGQFNNVIYRYDGNTMTRPFEFLAQANFDNLVVSGDVLYFTAGTGLFYGDDIGDGQTEIIEYEHDNGREIWYYDLNFLDAPKWDAVSLPEFHSTESEFNIADEVRPDLLVDLNDSINDSEATRLTAYADGLLWAAKDVENDLKVRFFDGVFAEITIDAIEVGGEGEELSLTSDEFHILGNYIFFTRADDNSEVALYYIQDLEGNFSSSLLEDEGVDFYSASQLEVINNRLYMQVDDYLTYGAEAVAVELTEGISTRFVADANSYGSSSSFCANEEYYVVSDEKAYFCVNDTELWETDGTVDGTQLVYDLYEADEMEGRNGIEILDMAFMGDNAYFVYRYSPEGDVYLLGHLNLQNETFSELIADGNDLIGIALLEESLLFGYGSVFGKIDILANPLTLVDFIEEDFAQISDFIMGDGVVYFMSLDEGFTRQIWETDGTLDGTLQVTSFDGNSASELNFISEKLYFMSDNKFWSYDGQNVVQLSPVEEGFDLVTDIVPYDNGVVLGASKWGEDSQQLYISNGESLNFDQITEFENLQSLQDIASIGSKIIFDLDTEDLGEEDLGTELWISDGTWAGTSLLKDIRLGSRSAGPGDFFVVGQYLYFEADNGESGSELFVTDGTAEGTELLADVYTGSYVYWDTEELILRANESSPTDFVLMGDTLLFRAADTDTGREPYAMAVDITPVEEEEPYNPPSSGGSGGGGGSKITKNNNDGLSGNGFTDVASDFWAKDFIDKLAEKCNVTGYADANGAALNIFGPGNQITRAEILKIIMGCDEFEFPENMTNPYSDLESGVWYYDYILYATQLGWVSGYGDGAFRPNQYVTRAEAMKIILLSMMSDSEITGGSMNFTDTDNAQWYAKYVAYAVQKGWVNGYVDENGALTGEFGPMNFITRAEAAKVVVNAKGL